MARRRRASGALRENVRIEPLRVAPCAPDAPPTPSQDALPMQLTVNGEPRTFPAPLSVAGLVEHLGLTGKRIAVERNGEIVPRGRHAETTLAEGDVLEIVVAVGGG